MKREDAASLQSFTPVSPQGPISGSHSMIPHQGPTSGSHPLFQPQSLGPGSQPRISVPFFRYAITGIGPTPQSGLRIPPYDPNPWFHPIRSHPMVLSQGPTPWFHHRVPGPRSHHRVSVPLFRYALTQIKVQKQSSRGVLRKRCSGNMQHRRTPMLRCVSIKMLCNFIEITLQHECSLVNLLHIFRTTFPKNTFERLLLKVFNFKAAH